MLMWCQWTWTREEHCFSHLTHSDTNAHNTHNPSAVTLVYFTSSFGNTHTFMHAHTHAHTHRDPGPKCFAGVQPRKPDVSCVQYEPAALVCVQVCICVSLVIYASVYVCTHILCLYSIFGRVCACLNPHIAYILNMKNKDHVLFFTN